MGRSTRVLARAALSNCSRSGSRTRRRPPARPPASLASPARPTLRRLLARRRRAILSLGLVAPVELADGPQETLGRRIARLDRWIGRELDLAGGKHFPPWPEADDDEEPDPEPTFRSQ